MTIEVTAKKVDDAIKQGLAELGASLDEVQVEILESGGLFRKAKVRLTLEREEEQKQEDQATVPQAATKPVAQKTETVQKAEGEKTDAKKSEKPAATPKQKEKAEHKEVKKEGKKEPAVTEKKAESKKPESTEPRPAMNSEEHKQVVAHATEFITELVKKMGFTEATVESNDNGDVAITAPAGDDSLIIGRHGETLSAISFLAETLGRAEKQHVSIVADCNGYRERRAASLTAMAKRRANECAAKRRKIKLEPMERVDRRTIHNALTDDDRVTTVSEGKEPYRYIVILPKKSAPKNESAE
ncbi:MAG: Jag N-terminal domain-containing protein [Clostridiales bacterium]|nr:Jag N-terminal domain-containing protein [Clostridiales bacterium]